MSTPASPSADSAPRISACITTTNYTNADLDRRPDHGDYTHAFAPAAAAATADESTREDTFNLLPRLRSHRETLQTALDNQNSYLTLGETGQDSANVAETAETAGLVVDDNQYKDQQAHDPDSDPAIQLPTHIAAFNPQLIYQTISTIQTPLRYSLNLNLRHLLLRPLPLVPLPALLQEQEQEQAIASGLATASAYAPATNVNSTPSISATASAPSTAATSYFVAEEASRELERGQKKLPGGKLSRAGTLLSRSQSSAAKASTDSATTGTLRPSLKRPTLKHAHTMNDINSGRNQPPHGQAMLPVAGNGFTYSNLNGGHSQWRSGETAAGGVKAIATATTTTTITSSTSNPAKDTTGHHVARSNTITNPVPAHNYANTGTSNTFANGTTYKLNDPSSSSSINAGGIGTIFTGGSGTTTTTAAATTSNSNIGTSAATSLKHTVSLSGRRRHGFSRLVNSMLGNNSYSPSSSSTTSVSHNQSNSNANGSSSTAIAHSSNSSMPFSLHLSHTFDNTSSSTTNGSSSLKISAPENPVHVTHVGYDNHTGKFTGLPREWQIMLSESGISKKEQERDPATMVEIVKFYERKTKAGKNKKTLQKLQNKKVNGTAVGTGTGFSNGTGIKITGVSTGLGNAGFFGTSVVSPDADEDEDDEDDVWHKFDHARASQFERAAAVAQQQSGYNSYNHHPTSQTLHTGQQVYTSNSPTSSYSSE
ncbi:signal transducing kinase of the PAK, partial [Ascosphaera aggregata]